MQESVETNVVSVALDLFSTQGFDQTSVKQIAAAAGMSRSTFFRQFGSKDDVIFSDHEVVLDELRSFFERHHEDPWLAVCEAAEFVFTHFAASPDLARRRYLVVRSSPTLREREIVMVFRYELLFDSYLRRALPGIDPIDAVGFAALVASVHNHILRRLLRGEDIAIDVLRQALNEIRRRYGLLPENLDPQDDDLVIAVFSRSTPKAEIAKQVQKKLETQFQKD